MVRILIIVLAILWPTVASAGWVVSNTPQPGTGVNVTVAIAEGQGGRGVLICENQNLHLIVTPYAGMPSQMSPRLNFVGATHQMDDNPIRSYVWNLDPSRKSLVLGYSDGFHIMNTIHNAYRRFTVWVGPDHWRGRPRVVLPAAGATKAFDAVGKACGKEFFKEYRRERL